MKKIFIALLVTLFLCPSTALFAQQPDSIKIAKAQQNIKDDKKDSKRIQGKIERKENKIKKQQRNIARKERRMNKKERNMKKEEKKTDQF